MHEQVKYVTARPSLANPKRWYWQRPGHPIVRLPNDLAQRIALADRLNREADGVEVVIEGSNAWVVDTYQASEGYQKLKSGTVKYYKRILGDIRAIAPAQPFVTSWTRRVVVTFVETYKLGMRKQVAAVLRNLFNVAIYYGYGTENQAREMRIQGRGPRTQVFTQVEANSWLDHCDDPAMRVAFFLLRYTVQRPNDCLTMPWTAYNGETIRLHQEKTGKLVEVPCHSLLKAELDAARKITSSTRIVSRGLRGMRYAAFREKFRKIADAAGLKAHQARDLRRTAAVYMAEAGCTEAQIASIGGWSIESARQILETYIPRTVEMAREAVRKWEQKDAKG